MCYSPKALKHKDAVFFDDLQTNVDAAIALGIQGVHVVDKNTVVEYF